jgi:CRP/FNR family transcriptional regulator
VAAFERVRHPVRRIGRGTVLYRVGDSFRQLFAVRSGSFKTCAVDAAGREHVVGFHFPGELLGADAVYPARHVSDAIALEDSLVCPLPYAAVTDFAAGVPSLNRRLLALVSRDLVGSSSIAGDYTADERLAGFLIMVTARLRRQRNTEVALPMSRQDMGNYLRLAPETISRILARFQRRGLLQVDGRQVTLTDREGLREIAAALNPWARWGKGQGT